MTRRHLFPLFAATSAAQTAPREIRLLSAAPSPFTRRRDSYRAGAGILLCLRRLIEEQSLPLAATYFDAAPLLGQPEKLKGLLRGPAVVLVGTSVWAQGPASVGREFLEAVNTESLAGVQASSWVTSGGAHTGGALAYESNLATLRSMGASVFSFGQKQMVFTTDERMGEEKAGEFTLLDCWFMEGLAKAAIVAGLAAHDRGQAESLWSRLGSHPNYYLRHFPKNAEELERRFSGIRLILNEAKAGNSPSRKKIDQLLGNK